MTRALGDNHYCVSDVNPLMGQFYVTSWTHFAPMTTTPHTQPFWAWHVIIFCSVQFGVDLWWPLTCMWLSGDRLRHFTYFAFSTADCYFLSQKTFYQLPKSLLDFYFPSFEFKTSKFYAQNSLGVGGCGAGSNASSASDVELICWWLMSLAQ